MKNELQEPKGSFFISQFSESGGEFSQEVEQLTLTDLRSKSRIISFSDMRQFLAASFVNSIQSLEALYDTVGKIIESEETLVIDNARDAATWIYEKAKLDGLLTSAKHSFEHIELTASTAQAERLSELFNVTEGGADVPDFRKVKQWLDDLRFWVNREMDGQSFVHLNKIEMREFWSGRKLAEEVQTQIPNAFYDLEEATKCLALERSTACVLHLMRTVDTTLNIIGAPIGLDTTSNPTWSAFLGKIPGKLNSHYGTKDEGWQHKNTFYRDILPYLYAIKNAWRNPSFHAASKYTEEEAREIFDAVKAFVKRLASNMPITL